MKAPIRSDIFSLRLHREADDPTQESNGDANEGCSERLAHVRKACKSECDEESSGNAELKYGGPISRGAIQSIKHDATPNNDERSDRRFEKQHPRRWKRRRAIQLVRLKKSSGHFDITVSRDNENQPQRVLIFSRNYSAFLTE
jgi:hypothetical protein